MQNNNRETENANAVWNKSHKEILRMGVGVPGYRAVKLIVNHDVNGAPVYSRYSDLLVIFTFFWFWVRSDDLGPKDP